MLNFFHRSPPEDSAQSNPAESEKVLSPSAQLGKTGEDRAACFLRQKGWRILARNWRSGHLELDIIAEDGNTLVFVEVKTRKAGGIQQPFEAFTAAKQSRLLRAAQAWLSAHQAWSRACRFDLICITEQNNVYHTELISHVIELGEQSPRHSLGRRNTTWQPW